jgi:hypothetical protein
MRRPRHLRPSAKRPGSHVSFQQPNPPSKPEPAPKPPKASIRLSDPRSVRLLARPVRCCSQLKLRTERETRSRTQPAGEKGRMTGRWERGEPLDEKRRQACVVVGICRTSWCSYALSWTYSANGASKFQTHDRAADMELVETDALSCPYQERIQRLVTECSPS